MTLAERKFQKALDEMILNATESELKQIQELDVATQMDGSNFYDIVSKHKKSAMASKTQSIKKK